MKKIHIFQLVLTISFILFLIFIFMPKNYTKEYKQNGISIIETYNKKAKSYYFEIEYQEVVFDYLIENKYKQDRKFINNIKIVKDELENFCIIPESKKLNFWPICYENKKIVHYNLANEELKKQLPISLFIK